MADQEQWYSGECEHMAAHRELEREIKAMLASGRLFEAQALAERDEDCWRHLYRWVQEAREEKFRKAVMEIVGEGDRVADAATRMRTPFQPNCQQAAAVKIMRTGPLWTPAALNSKLCRLQHPEKRRTKLGYTDTDGVKDNVLHPLRDAGWVEWFEDYDKKSEWRLTEAAEAR